jgi:hyperosmotically inducible periplasmic protein
MTLRLTLATVVAAMSIGIASGCAIERRQETVGAYVDDSAITSTIKARMVEDKAVDAAAIGVETLNGNVQLSGFATDRLEKQTAENIAIKVRGVKSVQNNITVRP